MRTRQPKKIGHNSRFLFVDKFLIFLVCKIAVAKIFRSPKFVEGLDENFSSIIQH